MHDASELCDKKGLRGEGVMGHMGDALTLTFQGMDNGQPEVFFGMYVVTDVKDDLSDY